MKKLLMLGFFVAVVGVGTLLAQSEVAPVQKKITKLADAKWTVDISAGFSFFQEYVLFQQWEENLVPGGTINQSIYSFPFHSGVDIYYHFTPRFALGLRTTMSYKQIDCFGVDGELLGHYVGLPTTVVVAGKFSYYLGRKFEFYGLYGLGLSMMLNVEDYHWRSTPSVGLRSYIVEFYPIGLRWGRKQGFFYELGLGSRGLTNLGYFVNF